MIRFLLYPLLACLISMNSPAYANALEQIAPQAFPELYRLKDTCNVYVLKSGDKALLLDLGSGKVIAKLPEIGVNAIDWILFTHHHREQCQGIGKVNRKVTQVAASEKERPLFEEPMQFRKWRPNLSDKFSVYGASYVRPPAEPISINRALKHGETFHWSGFDIECISTPGHSPGSMTYVIVKDDRAYAFTGDLIHDGAKMVTWFDTEWDYGFGEGLNVLIASVSTMIERRCHVLLPSHGPVITHPEQLVTYHEKLRFFLSRYVRGYPVFNQPNHERDSISQPTAVPQLNRVTPHLYKLSDASKGQNFAIIIADSGKALVLDCGLLPEATLHEIILGARQHLGLKQIDAFWISHMHGDHFLLGPALKRDYGAEAWTLDRIVDRCENPGRYDYAALINTYNDGFDGMKIDRSFRDGESIQWEGYRIQIDWMPGQTEFGCCLWLEIDGKRIAFTGDNLFGFPVDEKQDGHEAVVARNSAILEEGYIYGSKYLKDLNPDIVMGSHSYVMNQPAAFLSRYHQWSKEILQLYKELLPDRDYEYRFDPYWVSAYPYRASLSEENPTKVAVTIRNFREETQTHHVELKTPPGIFASPRVLEGTLNANERKTFDVTLTVDQTKADQGVQMVTFDVTLDGEHYGEWFDFLVLVPEAVHAPAEKTKNAPLNE